MRRPILPRSGPLAAGLMCAVLLAGCGDRPGSAASLAGPPQGRHAVLPASPLATIAVDGGSTRILPYFTDDLVTLQDPVNLVFTGAADPREIRNALLGLDGLRGAPFPPVFPFTCTWSDAIGGLMAGYGESEGWGGTAIQLQCGSYGPIRFHLRLVKLGGLTIGNAHFELLIPGTTDHQVLSWELAEQLVTYDLARTGLLGAAPSATAIITTAPAHRAIPAVIYNLLPADLRLLIGGPAGNVSAASSAVSATIAPPVVPPVVQTIVTSADTMAAASNAAATYGTTNQLSSRFSTGIESFLSFALPAAPAGMQLTSASLSVRTSTDSTSASAYAHVVHLMTGPWDEATLTWYTRLTQTSSGVIGELASAGPTTSARARVIAIRGRRCVDMSSASRSQLRPATSRRAPRRMPGRRPAPSGPPQRHRAAS